MLGPYWETENPLNVLFTRTSQKVCDLSKFYHINKYNQYHNSEHICNVYDILDINEPWMLYL